jgi:prophage DNA circulation protein
MADAFETLNDASLGGIVFPVGARNISGGRAFARRRYPFRDGQSTEGTGREPYKFSLTVPLFVDVDPSHYPDVYEALRAQLDEPDLSSRIEYVDPELGPLFVQVVDWTWKQTAEQRDGGRFEIELEEVSFDDFVFSTRVQDDRGAADLAAEIVDTTLEDVGVSDADVISALAAVGAPLGDGEAFDPGAATAGLLGNFTSALDDGVLAADELATRLDTLRLRLEAIGSLPELGTVAGWPAVQALSQLTAAVTQVADAALAASVPVVYYDVTESMSAWEIAVALYGDGERGEEVLRRNPSRESLCYRPGAQLRVLVR